MERGKILKLIRNRYFLVISFFVVWIFFFDQNNLIDRIKSLNKIKNQKKEKKYYEDKIQADKQRLNELRTDRENLEKFAREQYYMKRKDEDIFVFND